MSSTKSKIILSVFLGIIGGLIIGAGIYGRFFASADGLIEYGSVLYNISWTVIIVGAVTVAISIVLFAFAIVASEKKE